MILGNGMSEIPEYSHVSLKRPLVEGEDFYSDHKGIILPIGTEGVVLELIGDSILYVEFHLDGETEFISVLAKEVELISNP